MNLQNESTRVLLDITGHPRKTEPELSLFKIIDKISNSNHVPAIVVDFSSPALIHANQQINDVYGISLPDIIRHGLELTYELIDVNYKTIVKLAMQKLMHYYFNFSRNTRNNYLYCFTLYQKRLDGKKVWIQNTINFIQSDKEGKPVYALSYIQDITSIKKDNDVHMVIGNYRNGLFDTVVHERYSPDLLNLGLSSKEKEVLKMIADGWTSQEVSQKMNISILTVNKHRQNMLSKTNCQSVSELISLALKSGFL